MNKTKENETILWFGQNDDIFAVFEPYFLRKKITLLRAADMSSARAVLRENPVSYIIVASGEEKETGVKLALKVRKSYPDTVFLFLCESEKEAEAIRAKDSAFSCIVRPFYLRSLYERMSSVRRSLLRQYRMDNTVFSFGRFTFCYATRLLTFDGGKDTEKTFTLMRKEAGILFLLVQNMGKPVLRRRILSQYWPNTDIPSARSMDVFLCMLRKKLSLDSSLAIRSIHNKGFILITGETHQQ